MVDITYFKVQYSEYLHQFWFSSIFLSVDFWRKTEN
jgi:hypothetical protein